MARNFTEATPAKRLLELVRDSGPRTGQASRKFMRRALTPHIAIEIEVQAAKIQRLAERCQSLELERLRDETAALQMLIAEAAHEQRRL